MNCVQFFFISVVRVIGESAMDINPTLDNLNVAGEFKEFVMQNFTDWTYFKVAMLTVLHAIPTWIVRR